MIKIWQRIILQDILKSFLLFLFGFFTLYLLIDYSSHMQEFLKGKGIAHFELIGYYARQLIIFSPLIIPLSLLLATIKVSMGANLRRELLALQAGGISLKRFLTPFILCSFLISFFILISFQFLLPTSASTNRKFYNDHVRSYKGTPSKGLIIWNLEDGSELAFQSYDKEKKLFTDVMWIKNFDEIWHIKSIQDHPDGAVGFFVDQIVRNKRGLLEKKDSFDKIELPSLKLEGKIHYKSAPSHSELSITDLMKRCSNKQLGRQNEALSHLLYKLCFPLLTPALLCSLLPFCLFYHRHQNPFFIYGIALFSYIAFFTVLDSASILSENGVLSPFIAIITPYLLITLFSLYSLKKVIKA